ncbi:MAG TPA: condensation domain-containing protein, partial [Thermoanaerobaculia bacterium]|nr:condensation domain-containing protein [Thermoanaerobaculia bacterium]
MRAKSVDRVVPAAAEGPLSFGQEALWFLHLLAPESAAYTIAAAAWMGEGVDLAALRRAFARLVERHPALRTAFFAVDGRPRQRVLDSPGLDWEETDARGWTAPELAARMREEARRPFDLAAGRPLRLRIFRGSGRPAILLALHHLVADLWSFATLLRGLGELYRAETAGMAPALPPLHASYLEHVLRQRHRLAGESGDRLWSYWREQLAGVPPALDLPTDRPRPASPSERGDSRALLLEPALAAGVQALGRAGHGTLFMTLLAGFSALLGRYTQKEDLLVGTPTAGRRDRDLAEVVGYFVNPVVLRADLAADPAFAELLARTRRMALAAFDHQDYPFPLLAERLEPERAAGQTPLFQVFFGLQKAHRQGQAALSAFALGEAGARMAVGPLALESIALPGRPVQFDLSLMA